MDNASDIFGTDLSIVGQFVRETMNDEFAAIAVLTFFGCEALFALLPIEHARWKQAIALLVGGVLGLLILPTPVVDAALRGMLAGGATTMVVAKFKKKSSSEPAATVASVPAAVVAEARPEPVVALPEPVEHL